MKKLVFSTIVLMFVTLGWVGISLGEQPSEPRGEVRIVDKRRTNRWTVQAITTETLLAVNEDGTLRAQLASGWRWLDDRTLVITLRKGVRFHNGEVLDAEIIKRNWEAIQEITEYWGRLFGGNFAPGTRLEIIDPLTLRLVLPEPDARALRKLGVAAIANQQFFRALEQRSQKKNKPRPLLFWSVLRSPGPWGTGPYMITEGATGTRTKTSDQIVLEANRLYWDTDHFPRLQRIIFDYTLTQEKAVELIKTSEGQVDLVTGLRPLDTLRVAETPFAKVIKERKRYRTLLGLINMRKAESPWRDVRLRQAVNYAINRPDLLRYAAKGNGVLVASFLPPDAFGHDPTLAPHAFDPAKARGLIQKAGYPNGLTITLIATKAVEVQATVVSKMLEHVGFTVKRQQLSGRDFFEQTHAGWFLGPDNKHLNLDHTSMTWDIALLEAGGRNAHFNAYFPGVYRDFVLDGWRDWVMEEPAFRDLYRQLLRTQDREEQQTLLRQMEQRIHDQAYFLFLYSPIHLYAVNKEVQFNPHPSGLLYLNDIGVTDQHWSVREKKTAKQE